MQNILLAFAAGYVVATLLQKSAIMDPSSDPAGPTFADLESVQIPPDVKGIAGSVFPIHQGVRPKYLQL